MASEIGRRPYFTQLDGVRAIAAMMVMAFHFSQTFYPLRPMIFGQTGVDLFFVLSGFLISTLLLNARYRSWHEVRNFYIRRTLRIFPLYFGYLSIISLAGAGASWWFWAYLQNFPMAYNVPSLHGPTHFWSLAVEEQFYLVWPFLILFLPRHKLVHVMWCIVLGSVLLRMVIIPLAISPFYFTFTRLDGLAGGGLLALYLARGQLEQAKKYFFPGLLFFLSVLALVFAFSRGQGYAWSQVIKFSASSGGFCCLIGWLLTHEGAFANRILGSSPMRAIGRVSYGLYVYHPAVIGFIELHLGRFHLLFRFEAFVLLSYGISLLSFYVFERRFTDLKQRLAPELPFEELRPEAVYTEGV